jgi:PAS domain S-box-containing protein
MIRQAGGDALEFLQYHVFPIFLPVVAQAADAPQPSYAINKALTWSGAGFTVTVTLVAALLVINVIKRRRVEELIRRSRDRLLEQQKTLATLIRSNVFAGDDLNWTIHQLTETATRQMGVERVSLWLTAADYSAICCVDLYEKRSNRHTSGMELAADAYPVYFAALETEEVIVADDAHSHPQTRELSASYLDPLGITSILDVPVHFSGKVGGVLCYEHIGPAISWSPEQRFFAGALANLVALAIEQQERRLTEAALKHSEQRIRSLLETVPLGVTECDTAGLITLTNETFSRMTGYSKEEIVRMHIWDFMEPGPQKDALPRYFQHLVSEQPPPMLYLCRNLTKDGQAIDIQINWTYKRDREGSLIGFVCAISDISELRRAEAKFRDLFNDAGDAIFIHDLDGMILEVNKRACECHGYCREEFLGMNISRIDAPERPVSISSRIKELGKEGRAIFEAEQLRRDGSLIPVEVNSRIIEYEGRQALLSVVRDISERKEMERIKDEMISAVSHEMRTPLTAMLGYTGYMLENRVTPQQQEEFLRIVHGETERLDELIGNFLDLQRLKSSPGFLSKRTLDLHPLLEEAALSFGALAHRHCISVVCPADLPLVLGDSRYLHRAFRNLIANAIKYSPEGGEITLEAQQAGDDVIVRVSDEGIGIPREALERIFDRFFRVDNSASRRAGGTGLGLALVQEIVNAHQGRIWAESAIGKGSIIYVALPAVKKP